MTHVTGTVAAVPNDRKDAYIAHARKAAEVFRTFGATRCVESWGAFVPDGEVTSFPMAVRKKDDETVVFSWIEWPDAETAERCWASMNTDPRWKDFTPESMPFDGKRMIFGGFDVIVHV